MGGASSATARRRFRRARRLRESRRGVVAVIGTLLALLVFFALFGIFLTQYVPLWMSDNEAQFTANAAASFGLLKSSIDSQYVLGAPQTYGLPVQISSDSVPLLAQPTQGTLTFLPQICPKGFATATSANATIPVGQPETPNYCVFSNITLSSGPGGSGPYYAEIPTGVLEFALPNRYYSPQTFFFEDDAVIQSQGGGHEVMAVPPPLNVTNIAGNITVWDSLLQLYGNSTSVIGTGSQEIYSHLRYSNQIVSNGYSRTTFTYARFTYTFEIGTQNPCAWGSMLNNLVWNQSGLPLGDHAQYSWTVSGKPWAPAYPGTAVGNYTTQGTGCNLANGGTTVLILTVTNVNYAVFYQAGVQMGIGVGGA
ncbi:MAG TPA: hypothetical protein VEL82_02390 [Thermoplasmata archaeon]|nr:hypothetical protein [Thermoplasmata archaeon]